MLMNCVEIGWIIFCCWEMVNWSECDWLALKLIDYVNCWWEWYECGICWVEEWDIELWWWLKNDLSYWDCGLEIVDIDWNDGLYELFGYDGNELVV